MNNYFRIAALELNKHELCPSLHKFNQSTKSQKKKTYC